MPHLLAAQVKKFLRQLQERRWIDDPTRMVMLEFTLFNPFVGQYIAVRSPSPPLAPRGLLSPHQRHKEGNMFAL